MQRIKEEFLEKIEKIVPLHGLTILEIGCGDGSRSVDIAHRCKFLTGVEPDGEKVKRAQNRNIPNALFKIGSGDRLFFNDHSFDIIIFTLSLHHIPKEKMEIAINEAVRVVSQKGYIVFLEPSENGTFFDAEIKFDACDGDERKEKKAAHQVMLNHKSLKIICEIDDETVFRFESADDFLSSMNPKKNQEQIKTFLESNSYTLNASRRINIFQPID